MISAIGSPKDKTKSDSWKSFANCIWISYASKSTPTVLPLKAKSKKVGRSPAINNAPLNFFCLSNTHKKGKLISNVKTKIKYLKNKISEQEKEQAKSAEKVKDKEWKSY